MLYSWQIFDYMLKWAYNWEITNNNNNNNNNNNSVKLFIIYVPSQQLQGQLQTQHSVDTGNYIMDKHNMK
jgi:hypothetical protein